MLDFGLLFLRVSVGLILAAHGAQKLFGWFGGPGLRGTTGFFGSLGLRPAGFWALIAALAEFAGGLLVALGLLGPVGPALLFGVMLVAGVLVHKPNGFWNTAGGYEFPLLIAAAAVTLALTGPGRYALDSLLDLRLHDERTAAATLLMAIFGAFAGLASTRVTRIRSRLAPAAA